jgi:hypothetical protein
MGRDVCQGALKFFLLSLFLFRVALSYRTRRVSSVALEIVGGVVAPLPYYYHCARDIVDTGHNTIKDGVDRTPDVVLRILVDAVGVLDHLCVRLLGHAQAAIHRESEGDGVVKVTQLGLACENVLYTSSCSQMLV